MQIRFLLLTLFSAGLLAACAGDERPVYQGAEYYKNLEIPPDLNEPDTTDAVRVPRPTDAALQQFRENNKLESVITPKFDGIRMVSFAGDSWLEIDHSVDYVWPRAEKFFETEGIEIVDAQPLLGYIETEWTTKFSPEGSFLTSLVQRLEPDQKHKFRLRLERFENDSKTRVYITHTVIEKLIRGEFNEDVVWVTRRSSIEEEREMLSRMALFAGLDGQQTSALIENYRPYTSLVKVDRTDTTSLTMTGSMDFVWRRALRALDRMGMNNIKSDESAGKIFFSFNQLKDDDIGIDPDQEEDDIAESSWLMQLFTGKGEDSEASVDSGQYRLELSTVGGAVKISVRDQNSDLGTDDDGETYSNARVEQLRNALRRNLD